MHGLNHLSATEAVRKLARREITASALLADCLARIDERDSAIRAWTHVDAASAMERARSLDTQASVGLLHGLPIGVKDVFDTFDMPTGYGSPIYGGHRPAADAACVALARAAGAVVVGKTVTTEFATFHPGPTRNPHHLAHTPGGSSSGSAAAVADLMVPLAFGSQTAGSIVRPAAFCGVVGYKPTFGTIVRAGVKMLSDTLDTPGVFTRTVADAALFVAAVAGRREWVIEGTHHDVPRIGLCRTHHWTHLQPESVAAFDDAARSLGAAGASIRDIELPSPFAGLAEAQIAIMEREAVESLADERYRHPELLSEPLWVMLASGQATSAQRYDAARTLAREARAAIARVFGGVDVLLAPSAIGEAPEGTATGDPLMNRMWTLLHMPCVHLPTGVGPRGLPVGVTVVGPAGGDRATLLAADWIHARLSKP